MEMAVDEPSYAIERDEKLTTSNKIFSLSKETIERISADTV